MGRILSISSSWLRLQKSRMLSAMGGGGDGAPIQGLAAGLPPPTQKELAQALDVTTRFEEHIAQVNFWRFTFSVGACAADGAEPAGVFVAACFVAASATVVV